MNRYGYGMMGPAMPMADRRVSLPESYLDMVRMRNSGVPDPVMYAESLRPNDPSMGEAVRWTGENMMSDTANYWKQRFMELVGDGGDSVGKPSNIEAAPAGDVGEYMGKSMDNELRRREEIKRLMESGDI